MNSHSTNKIAVLIKELYHPNKECRAKTVQKVVKYGNEAVEPLLSLLHDPDWRIRYRAAEALGLIRSIEPVQELIQACNDEKDHVRYMAAKSLGIIRDARAVQTLIHMLNDEHQYTRGIAATGLALIGDSTAKREIEAALARETDQTVKEKMIQSLKTLNGE
ncbi:HEAT repeat domain-containing protein [Methanospirillum lacunae]|uniref:PBS lyase n=1 Tax=Methanospirillum lacunae TaxID=668570 RepID=A0A2V2MUX3_9EURY|nr:HEAT repeat domain-containing protein [Methanospirillum lacunae]PWR71974.1 PBS lyase [Methanospirillum lacunae]